MWNTTGYKLGETIETKRLISGDMWNIEQNGAIQLPSTGYFTKGSELDSRDVWGIIQNIRFTSLSEMIFSATAHDTIETSQDWFDES